MIRGQLSSFSRLSVLALVLTFLALAGCGGSQSAGSGTRPAQPPAPAAQGGGAATNEPILIGSIWPLTGSSASTANDGKRAMEIAVDMVNKKGGVLGHPVKVLFEDDKGDPKTGVTSIEKFMTQDKVYAIVGGIGSGQTKAYIGALQKYPSPPIYVSTGSSATSIEQEFGQLDWMFFVHPWEYQYQESMTGFFNSLQPKPQNVAVAYEDGLYGTSQTDVALQLLKPLGISVPMREAFKTGATDVSGIITRAKSMNPDVFYWVGYGSDAILITRQSKELNFSPKLFASTSQASDPEYYKAVSGDAEGVIYLAGWVPGTNYPASSTMPDLFPSTADFLKEYKARYGTDTPQYYAPMTFSAFMSLIAGIQKAGTLDKAAVIKAMEQLDTMTPMGPLKITPSRYAKHHYYNRMLVGQWQKGQRVIVYPPDAANGKVVYPVPAWNQR